MQNRVIAIGDIHGCAQALAALLEAIKPVSSDTFVPLGDYVDRGPDSRGAIEMLIELSSQCSVIPIRGNHEEMMLEVVVDRKAPQYWLQYGGTATLDSYGFAGDLSVIPSTHIDFLQSCRDHYQTETHFFVHANYDASLPLEEQEERTIRWTTLQESMPPAHHSGKVAVVGHTPDPTGEVFSLRHLKCIDTFCYGGGWLTALDVQSGQVWQADDEGKPRLR